MTSKLTKKERVQALYDLKIWQILSLDDIENIKMLALMALAAMDSEPVAIVEPSDYITAAQLVGEGPARKAVHELYEGALRIGDKLYRHAQPALDGEPVAWKYEEYVYVSGLGHLWREKLDCEFPGIECGTLRGVVPLYRHAQQPVVPDDVLDALQKVARIRLDMNDFDGDRRGIADCLGDAEEALIEVVNRRAAMLQGAENAESRCGNSPVILEGWQGEAEKLAEMHGMSFVLFRHGEDPQCADPTKVVISFTDKGLGQDTLPAAPQEPKP